MAILLSIPDEDKALVPAIRGVLSVLAEVRAQTQGKRHGQSVDFGLFQTRIAEATAQIECAANQEALQSLDVDAPRLVIRGQTYQRVGRGPGTYFTMAGSCEVVRSLYQREGQPDSPVVDPVSLRAGVLLEGWLPLTAQAMAHEVQRGPAREAAQGARQTHRLPYSDTSFERVAHAVGAHYIVHELDVEQKLIEDYLVPAQVTGVCVSVDRVSVPMEEPHPTDPKAITRVYRMGYCGTVMLHDSQGQGVYTIRYGRMPYSDVVGLMEAMQSDVYVMRQQRPDLQVSTCLDGAVELWGLVDTYLNERTLGVPVARLIDLWHNVEKLGKAARVIHGAQGSDAVVNRWKMMLLNESDAASQILGELEASGSRQIRVGEDRPVHEAITYLENHLDRMDYATARQQGRPVGSGPVEATGKSLYEVRMKRTGSRWKDSTGDHIVRLRALALSTAPRKLVTRTADEEQKLD